MTYDLTLYELRSPLWSGRYTVTMATAMEIIRDCCAHGETVSIRQLVTPPEVKP